MVSSIANFFTSPLSLAVQRALPQNAKSQSGGVASDNSQQLVSILLSGLSMDSSQGVAGLSGQPYQLAQTLKQLSSAKDDAKAERKEQEIAASNEEGNTLSTDRENLGVQGTAEEKTSEAVAQSGINQEDLDFANEARKLLNDLKNIIRNAKQKMQHDGGGFTNTDIEEAEKALHETSSTLNQIVSDAFSAPANVAVNILA